MTGDLEALTDPVRDRCQRQLNSDPFAATES
jgi:hypothetical protein